MPCFSFILGIPVKDWLFFSQQLNSPAFLRSCGMIPVVINCLHFSEYEVCWFCNTKHFLSFLCHVLLAMISHTEHVVYLLYDKCAILKENHAGYVGGRICGQGPPFCGFTFNFSIHCSQRQKDLQIKLFLWKTKVFCFGWRIEQSPQQKKTAAQCRKQVYVIRWMDAQFIFLPMKHCMP